MEVVDILSRLHEQGFQVTAEGDRLQVRPASRVTDELRSVLRAHKPQLLQALSGMAAELDADAREYIAERQAIGEIDGGLSPDEAARMATARIYQFRLTDDPHSWLLVLAKPGDGPAEVAASLRSHFGSARVIEVHQYNIR